MSSEVKFLDTALDDTTIGSTATITRLTQIGLGTAENEHTGRIAHVVGCDWRYSVGLDGRSGSGDNAKTSDIVRILLVQDTQSSDGSVFSATDLFDSDTWDAFFNLANQDRFVILHDEDIAVQVGSGAGNVTAYVWGEGIDFSVVSLDLDIPLVYDGENAITINELSWVTTSFSGNCRGTGQFRLRFVG